MYWPVPLRLTTADAPLEALLPMVKVPVAGMPAAGANCTISVIPSKGFKVTGRVAPDTVKPVPLIIAELILNGAVPVEVSVTGSIASEPSFTVPKLKLFGFTVSCGAMPLQVKATATALCLNALLLIVTLPFTEFAAFGANVTFSLTVCRGFNVSGKVAPDTASPAPLIDGKVMVNGPVPVDVTVIDNDAVDPTGTLPKFRLIGLTVSSGLVAATPVLARWITVFLCLSALLMIVSAPVAALAIGGAAVTFSVIVCLGFSVSGKVAPDTENAVPRIIVELIVNGPVPVDVTVIANVAVDPTVTSPKLKRVELTDSCATPGAVAAPELLAACAVDTADK